jgi:hypothetical protein
MSLSRVMAGWIVTSIWLLASEAAGRGWLRPTGGPLLRGPLWLYLVQALLLTLLAALWFGSLGSGEWWLLFALLGGLLEVSPGQTPPRWSASWRAALSWAARVGRIVAAGGLLAWRMGSA